MKKLLVNLVVTATLLANSITVVAQLVSTPLDAGMQTFVKEASALHGYTVTPIDDYRLKVSAPSGDAAAWIEYLADDDIRVSGTVGTFVIQNELGLRDLQSRIDEFNASAPVGTLKFDSKSGILTMDHHMNPRHVGPTAMAKVTMKFLETLVRLQQRFGGKLA